MREDVADTTAASGAPKHAISSRSPVGIYVFRSARPHLAELVHFVVDSLFAEAMFEARRLTIFPLADVEGVCLEARGVKGMISLIELSRGFVRGLAVPITFAFVVEFRAMVTWPSLVVVALPDVVVISPILRGTRRFLGQNSSAGLGPLTPIPRGVTATFVAAF
eukprot:CAMPEP_0206490110 /NCGR_PEP_ID=MMETSP0324_2-20121206/43784_1 /ASSEMBLY_ACC=CAM_ASM_000836 /TAXON_ID=2866 /ORGANISM="Crypthecodinium cohnii, Strain Seligo" /LENGTH=163 /DNA_ID=CAMNT_0053970205 /DNA_START=234 /DNA_END=722 /DNA_ORIENTATION=-